MPANDDEWFGTLSPLDSECKTGGVAGYLLDGGGGEDRAVDADGTGVVGVVGGDVAAGGSDKVGERCAVEARVVLGEGVAGESEHFCVAIGDQHYS